MSDLVTGASVTVTMDVALPADKVWGLVTDVARYGQHSPECVSAAWLEPAPDEPTVGAGFVGTNLFGGQFRTQTVCVVSEARRPDTFAWAVLDDAWDPARPGSWWRYELLPGEAPDHTRLRHTFTHGPGNTGMRAGAERDAAAVHQRLVQIRENITVALGRMTGGRLIEERA